MAISKKPELQKVLRHLTKKELEIYKSIEKLGESTPEEILIDVYPGMSSRSAEIHRGEIIDQGKYLERLGLIVRDLEGQGRKVVGKHRISTTNEFWNAPRQQSRENLLSNLPMIFSTLYDIFYENQSEWLSNNDINKALGKRSRSISNLSTILRKMSAFGLIEKKTKGRKTKYRYLPM